MSADSRTATAQAEEPKTERDRDLTPGSRTSGGITSGSLTPTGRGVRADRVFRTLTLGSGLLVLVILALILLVSLRQAWPALRYSGWHFVLSGRWVPNDPDGAGPLRPHFGALSFIFGTAVVSVLALLVAIPVSVAIALFLTELAPQRMRPGMVTAVDLLAAIP